MKQPSGKAEGGQTPGAQRVPDAAPGKGPRESQGAPGNDRPKATDSQHEKSPPKSGQTQPEKGQPKATERQPEKAQPKATERQPEKAQPKATERQPEKAQKSTQGQPQETQHTSRVQVSEQQRSGVRDRLFKEGKFQKTRLNVRANVGTRVPRSVRLLPMPIFILDLAPAYRGYSYVVLEDDTICIVDPQTYDIVDVIDTGSQQAGRPQRTLALSQDQMRFISANLPREPRANVRVRLALGAEVPHDVELLAFPREIVSQLPDLDGYRYIVAENDIVVVGPHDRGVVLVITD